MAVGYSVMLPFAYTQRISFRNWHYLDTRYVAFSIAFGVATGWLLMSQTYAIRRVVRSRGGMVGGRRFHGRTTAEHGVLFAARRDISRTHGPLGNQPHSRQRSDPILLRYP